MKRKIGVLICCALLISFLAGCQLAMEDAGPDAGNDRMIGIFATREYLSDIMPDGDAGEDHERLYAVLSNEGSGEREYIFPGVEGISFFSATVPETEEYEGYIMTPPDSAITDRKTDLRVGDMTSHTVLEGTVYLSAASGTYTYYFNPVYQSSDGSVYAVTGSGMSASPESEGPSMSFTIDTESEIVENGKNKTDSIFAKLSFSVMFTPEKIVFLQMDEGNRLLSQTEYEPDALSESISLEPEVAYIIVETHKRNAVGETVVARNIYDRDAESIETFFAREDGVCVKRWTQIVP